MYEPPVRAIETMLLLRHRYSFDLWPNFDEQHTKRPALEQSQPPRPGS